MNKLEAGEVKFSTDVISSIVEIAINETKNSKSSKSLVDKVMNKGTMIKVANFDDGNIDITIGILVKYGVNIPEVAINVQENVISNVESMTGLTVKNVNVNVDGLYFDTEIKK